MKIMSNKNTNRINPFLTKFTNSTEPSNSSHLSYDDLILFEEILSAELNKTFSNQGNSNITKENINKTVKTITENVAQSHDPSWNFESEDSDKMENEKTLPQHPSETDDNDTEKNFDPQQLIERMRKSFDKIQINSNYELLTCKSQSFLQRLAVLGEILS